MVCAEAKVARTDATRKDLENMVNVMCCIERTKLLFDGQY
jgi:hypothetical protein